MMNMNKHRRPVLTFFTIGSMLLMTGLVVLVAPEASAQSATITTPATTVTATTTSSAVTTTVATTTTVTATTPAQCNGKLTATITRTGPGSASVTFYNRTTRAELVGFASYKAYDNVIANQELYDSASGTVAACSQLSLTIMVPGCAYQLDAFYGPVLNGAPWYYERNLDSRGTSGAYCTRGTPSPTPSTPASTTPASTAAVTTPAASTTAASTTPASTTRATTSATTAAATTPAVTVANTTAAVTTAATATTTVATGGTQSAFTIAAQVTTAPSTTPANTVAGFSTSPANTGNSPAQATTAATGTVSGIVAGQAVIPAAMPRSGQGGQDGNPWSSGAWVLIALGLVFVTGAIVLARPASLTKKR